MNLPKDPVILLSFINTKLRDEYPCLKDFCDAYECSEEEVIHTLQSIDYHYNPDTNQFQ